MNTHEEKADINRGLDRLIGKLKRMPEKRDTPSLNVRADCHSLNQDKNDGSMSNSFRINNKALDLVDYASNPGAQEKTFQTDTTGNQKIPKPIVEMLPLNSGLFEPNNTVAVIENAPSYSNNIELGQPCQDFNWSDNSPVATTEYNAQIKAGLSDPAITFEKFIEEDFIVDDPDNTVLPEEGFSTEKVLETTKLENEASSVNVSRQVGLGEIKEAIKNTVAILNEEDHGDKEEQESLNFAPPLLPTCSRVKSFRGFSEVVRNFNPQTIRNGNLAPAKNSEYQRKLEAMKAFKPEVITPGEFHPRAPAPSAIKGLSKQKYICEYCHREFEAAYKLINHVRIHKGPVLHRCSCDKCGIPFRDYRTMSKRHNDSFKRC